MSLIDPAVLLGIADRAAWQSARIIVPFSGINPVGGGLYFTRVTDTDDPDVEIPCDNLYDITDNNIAGDWDAALGATSLRNVVNGMLGHFSRVGQVGGWDGYLQAEDERVSDWFNHLHKASGHGWMLAINVFSESLDRFATAEVVAGPAVDFTDGVNYGDGSVTNVASGSYFAATQLQAQPLTNIGGTDLDLRLDVKDINDAPTTIDVTIPAGTAALTTISIGTASDRFLDVTGVDFVPAGDEGTVGDIVRIINLQERVVAP